MTFPRRLTPSEKERATIVQQRMTPGSALGVGSRHVRTGAANDSGAQTSTGPGGIEVVAQFSDSDTYTLPADAQFSSLSGDPGSLVDEYFTFQSLTSTEVAARILQSGWYSVYTYAIFSGQGAGDAVKVEADSARIPACVGYGFYILGTPTVAQASTGPFFLYDDPSILPVDILGVTSGTSGSVTEVGLFITRYSGTDAN